jgi:hypothetical protein
MGDEESRQVFDWLVESRGCDLLTGWRVVMHFKRWDDSFVIVGKKLTLVWHGMILMMTFFARPSLVQVYCEWFMSLGVGSSVVQHRSVLA